MLDLTALKVNDIVYHNRLGCMVLMEKIDKHVAWPSRHKALFRMQKLITGHDNVWNLYEDTYVRAVTDEDILQELEAFFMDIELGTGTTLTIYPEDKMITLMASGESVTLSIEEIAALKVALSEINC
jgi:hypothetical protein